MSFKKIGALIIFVPIAVILIAFIIANRGSVPLNLNIFAALFGKTGADYSFTAPLFLWLFLFLLLGIGLGALSMLPKLRREKQALRLLQTENSRLQAELVRAKPKAAAANNDASIRL